MSKKLIWTLLVVVSIVVAVIILLNSNSSKNVKGTLEELMTKLYADIPKENLPMMLGNIELNSENVESFIGTKDVSFKEAMANESMTGSIAHSVVLLRLNNASEADATVQKIKLNANPRKWICVEASNVIVKGKGDLVILIMSNSVLAPELESNFNKL